MLYDLILKNRSYRRFDESHRLSEEELLPLVDAARLSPSAGNLQRIRYAVVSDAARCDAIFGTLAFAAYLKDFSGPAKGERPAAYIVLFTEKEPDATLGIDIGIATEAILLSAVERGLGACVVRSFRRKELNAVFGCTGGCPELVIALGVPAERVRLVGVTEGDIRYYRLPDGTHCVPKRSLAEVLLMREDDGTQNSGCPF